MIINYALAVELFVSSYFYITNEDIQ